MKKLNTMMLLALAVFTQLQAQSDSPTEKGNRMYGVSVLLTDSDLYYATTDISFTKDDKSAGLNIAPDYGWFVQRNWLIGSQLNIGYHKSKYENSYGGPNNFQQSKSENSYFNYGITPFTRYYVDLGKKNKVKLFASAAIAFFNEQRKYFNESTYTQTGQPPFYSKTNTNETNFNIRGSIGFGVALFGRSGNIDLHASNAGLFVGFHKTIGKRK
jgi:hypothetical protein